MPLGGYLATRYQAPTAVMFSGLTGTVIIGGLIPLTGATPVTFLLFGIFYAVSAPVVASLPAEVLSVDRQSRTGLRHLLHLVFCGLRPTSRRGWFADGCDRHSGQLGVVRHRHDGCDTPAGGPVTCGIPNGLKGGNGTIRGLRAKEQ